MSEKAQTFPSHEDYASWDKLIEGCLAVEGLPEDDRASAGSALSFIRNEFGESFLKKALKSQHPIARQLINTAPWTRHWLIALATAIQAASSCRGYESLRERLTDAARFDEGFSVLETAWKFLRKGFEVSFDHSIAVEGAGRVIDLMVRDPQNGCKFLCEVTELTDSDQWRKGSGVMLQLTMLSMTFPLRFAGRLISYPEDSRELERLIRCLQFIAKRVHKAQGFRTITVPGYIEIGFAAEANLAQLTAWATAKKLEVNNFSGPVFDGVNELNRIVNKIRKKKRQLSAELPNILLIKTAMFLALYQEARYIDAAISVLEEAIRPIQHLAAVIVCGQQLGEHGENNVRSQGVHLDAKATLSQLLWERRLLIQNPIRNTSIPQSTLVKIREAIQKT